MNECRFFLGPMTKNVVDCCIEYANEFDFPLTFIPSRRQIEFNGGYVNNWTTNKFTNYVKSRTSKIQIERDHGGAGQGSTDDDGIESLTEDCNFMDIIHIDPWKKYKSYEEGLNETIIELNHCYKINPNLYFEIATEEGIRMFEVDELEKFILDLQKKLDHNVYSRIKYFVIQCGTKLLETTNIGIYDKERLSQMIALCNKYNFISKEHNGDWVNISLVKEKFDLGLKSINIAPELGEIETRVILEEIKNLDNAELRAELFEKLYEICYQSNKWTKWVSNSFVPSENKERLILICGHYILSTAEFIQLKDNYLVNLDFKIRKNIFKKLNEYHSILDSYYKVFITTSGIGSRLGEMTKYTNKSLIKIGDKLAISRIIEKYNKYCEFVITIGYYGKFVKDFLELAYPEHNFTFVWVDNYEELGSSLGYSMLCAKDHLRCAFMYNCCDSIVTDIIEIPTKNTLFVSNKKNSTLYATINIMNKIYVKDINKKGEIDFDYSYTGISFVKDYHYFWSALDLLYEKNKFNSTLSDVDVHIQLHNMYDKKYEYQVINDWYDSGNITEINQTLMNKFKCKYNVLNKNDESICFFDSFVIKFFYDVTTCKNRVIRGKSMGNLVPIIIDFRDNFIKMELIDGILMSENHVYGEIKNLLKWSNRHLWRDNLSSTNNPVDMKELCIDFYKNKTMKRVENFLKTSKDVSYINKIHVGTIYELLDKLNFDMLCDTTPSIFHGDFILDNILKTGDNEYKLIDWRQDFAGRIDVGDKYYDLAKLRHNIFVNHENILNNLFKVHYEDNNNVIVDIKCNYIHINQLNDFDQFVLSNGLNLKKIKILTALIWINMAPLHDKPFNEFLFYFGKYNLFLSLI